MKNLIRSWINQIGGLIFLSVLMILSASQNTYAGGCHLEEVSQSKEAASSYLAGEIRSQVIEIEKAMRAKGQELKVVMIARSGESLEKFDLITDNLAVSLQEHLSLVAQRVSENICKGERGAIATSTNSKTCAKPSTAVLPKEFLLKDKLSYSHVGFLVKRNLIVESGLTPSVKAQIRDWEYVVHLLSKCDEAAKRYGPSQIFYEKFGRFFWDTKVLDNKDSARRAMIVVPSVSMQDNLFNLINNQNIAANLHQTKYNVAATPFTLQGLKNGSRSKNSIGVQHQLEDQNSNQWPLEMLAAATRSVGVVRSRAEAQSVMLALNYRPSLVWPTGLKESAACQFAKGPFGLWDATNIINCKNQVFKDQHIYQLITVKSLTDFLDKNNLLANVSGASPTGLTEVQVSKEEIDEVDAFVKNFEAIWGDSGADTDVRKNKPHGGG